MAPPKVEKRKAPNGKEIKVCEETILEKYPEYLEHVGMEPAQRNQWVADRKKEDENMLTTGAFREIMKHFMDQQTEKTNSLYQVEIKPKIAKLEEKIAKLEKKVADLQDEIRMDRRAEKEIMLENCGIPDTDDQKILTEGIGAMFRQIKDCEEFKDADICFVKPLRSPDGFLRFAATMSTAHVRDFVVRRAYLDGKGKFVYASKFKSERREGRRVFFGNQWCNAKNLFHKGAKFFKFEKVKGKPKKQAVQYAGNSPQAADLAAKWSQKQLPQPKLNFTNEQLKSDKVPYHLMDQMTLPNKGKKDKEKEEEQEEMEN